MFIYIQSADEDCISYMSDNTQIYMDINHPDDDDDDDNNDNKYATSNGGEWSKSLTQLTQFSSLNEFDTM